MVASPHGKIHGQRLSGWLATFYSHALELPSDDNPLVGAGDPCPVVDGVLLHYGIDATTVCTVPEGTPVLVPSIIAPACDGASSGEFHGGPDLASLLACAHRIRANFRDETFTLDGAPVRRLDRYMVETDRFVVTYPADNPFGVDPGPTFAGAVGTTLIFKHLQPGEHTIINTLVEKSDPTNMLAWRHTSWSRLGDWPKDAHASCPSSTFGCRRPCGRRGVGGVGLGSCKFCRIACQATI